MNYPQLSFPFYFKSLMPIFIYLTSTLSNISLYLYILLPSKLQCCSLLTFKSICSLVFPLTIYLNFLHKVFLDMKLSLGLSWDHLNTPVYIFLLNLASTDPSYCLLKFFILFCIFTIWLIRSTCLTHYIGKSISNFLTATAFEHISYLFPKSIFGHASKFLTLFS